MTILQINTGTEWRSSVYPISRRPGMSMRPRTKETLMKSIPRISSLVLWGLTLFWLFLVQVPALAAPAIDRAPNVVGQTEAQARNVLEKAGFNVHTFPRLTGDQAQHGKVQEQSPVRANKAIILMIYKYEAIQVLVPNVVGTTKDQAREIIKKAELTNQAIYDFLETDNQALIGRVARQEPAAGTKQPRGSEVKIYTYRYLTTDKVEVPNVVGLTSKQAEADLGKAGLEVSRMSAYTDNPALVGKVVKQDHAPGNKIMRRSVITITIYRVSANTLTLPNLVGLNRTQVTSQLLKAGYKVHDLVVFKEVETSDAKLHDKVASQMPLAGQALPANSHVTVTVYKRTVPDQVEVPMVSGLPLNQARDRLHSAKLNAHADAVYEVANQREKDNTVAIQTPAAGAKVKPATTVNLKLYRYREPDVMVPLVVNKSVNEARKLLEQHGFQVTVTAVPVPTQKSDQDGKVAKQSPTGIQKRGTKIELMVYKLVKLPGK